MSLPSLPHIPCCYRSPSSLRSIGCNGTSKIIRTMFLVHSLLSPTTRIQFGFFPSASFLAPPSSTEPMQHQQPEKRVGVNTLYLATGLLHHPCKKAHSPERYCLRIPNTMIEGKIRDLLGERSEMDWLYTRYCLCSLWERRPKEWADPTQLSLRIRMTLMSTNAQVV